MSMLDPFGLIGALHRFLVSNDSESSPGGYILQGLLILLHLIIFLGLLLGVMACAKALGRGAEQGFVEAWKKD